MVMQSLRNRASGGIGKFILFGLLGMAVAGLALSDFRGVLDGGVSSNDVAKIGDQTIGIQDFHRTVQRNLAQYRQYGITPQQAYKLGLIDEMLTGEIRKTFIVNEAHAMGIEIGREQLKKRLSEIIAPQMQGGETPQQTLDNILRNQGFTEAKFIAEVKKEMAAEILTGAIKEGFVPNTKQIAQDLFLFQNQSRDIEIILFPNTEITDITPPTDDQLKNLYESVKATQYKIPETRTVKAAMFDPIKIEVNVTVTEEEIKEAYESNKDAFLIDEQLVITQILVDAENQGKADEIYKLIQSGKSLKDAGQDVLGAQMKYIEKVAFETYAMLPVMNEALSEREIGVTKPPVQSPLGIHIMKLEEVIPPTIKPYDTVKGQIKSELETEKKSEEIYKIVTNLEARLNKGEGFDAIKDEVELNIFTLENVDLLQTNWDNETIDLSDIQAAIQAIFAIEEGQNFSLLEELPSGKFIAFNLIRKNAQSYKPFEDIKLEIEQQFIKDQQATDNKLKMNKLLAEFETGGSTLQTISNSSKKDIIKIENIKIGGPVATPLNEAVKPIIFKTSPGELNILDLGDQFALMRVASFELPELAAAEEGQLEAIQDTLNREAEEEALLMYVRYLGGKYEAKINKPLLDQAYRTVEE